jgi:hypothetical protein
MSFCPITSRCSAPRPRLLPLPRHFLPYFENRDQTMDREMFRRMVVKWIREVVVRSSDGACRRSSDPSRSF